VVPHLPPTEFGFNHIGDEIWYFNEVPDNQYKTCINGAGKPEDPSCADSIIATGTSAHLQYLGKFIGSMCAPGAQDEIDPQFII